MEHGSVFHTKSRKGHADARNFMDSRCMSEHDTKQLVKELAHFKGGIRKGILCLYTAMPLRVLWSRQSSLIKTLEENQEAYRYLLLSRKKDKPKVSSVSDLTSEHILTSICQNKPEQVRQSQIKALQGCSLFCWLDPKCSESSRKLASILSHLSQEQTQEIEWPFSWGDYCQQWDMTGTATVLEWLEEIGLNLHLEPFLVKTLKQALTKTMGLFASHKAIQLSSDGCLLNIEVKGEFPASNEEQLDNCLASLENLNASHLSLFLSDENRIQISFPLNLEGKKDLQALFIFQDPTTSLQSKKKIR